MKENALKCKGVSLKQNKHITYHSNTTVMEQGQTIDGQNIGLQIMRDNDKVYHMSRTRINKTALTGKMTKCITLSNGTILPFIH